MTEELKLAFFRKNGKWFKIQNSKNYSKFKIRNSHESGCDFQQRGTKCRPPPPGSDWWFKIITHTTASLWGDFKEGRFYKPDGENPIAQRHQPCSYATFIGNRHLLVNW
jgi:hypothetical protein